MHFLSNCITIFFRSYILYCLLHFAIYFSLFGLTGVIDVDCDKPWLLQFHDSVEWQMYVNPCCLIMLYFTLAVETRRWFHQVKDFFQLTLRINFSFWTIFFKNVFLKSLLDSICWKISVYCKKNSYFFKMMFVLLKLDVIIIPQLNIVYSLHMISVFSRCENALIICKELIIIQNCTGNCGQ